MSYQPWLEKILIKLNGITPLIHEVMGLIEFPEQMMYEEEKIVLKYITVSKKITAYCYYVADTDIIHGPRIQYKNDNLFTIEFWRYGQLDVWKPSILFEAYETLHNKSLPVLYN